MTRAKDISKILTDADISGNIDVDGVTNLDVVDIDGAVDMASTLKVGGSVGIGMTHVANYGLFQLGSAVTSALGVSGLQAFVSATNAALGQNGNMSIITTNGQAADIGGSIGLGGKYNASGNSALFGHISGRKENATDSNSAGYLQFASQPNGGVPTERMRITSAGKVGIGTTSPTSPLEISNSLTHSLRIHRDFAGTAASSATIRFAGDDSAGNVTDYAEIRSLTEVVTNGSEKGALLFGTLSSGSVTERMRITSNGGVAVGTTSAGLGIMAVHGASGGNATFKAANTSNSGNTTCIMAFMDGSGSATSNSAFLQGFNGVTSYYLLGNGTHTFTSDENVKKNIETTRDGYLNDLAKLRVVKYNWKHEEDGTNKELGLIAQEVEEVFPNLVMEDFDPQIEEGQRRNKMIKVTVLPFMLLKAIQELSEKNDAQQTLIESMEARITALESA